jgi:putative salt-induced outer membrane protein
MTSRAGANAHFLRESGHSPAVIWYIIADLFDGQKLMNKKKLKIGLAILSLVFSLQVWGEEAEKENEGPWSGSVSIGYLSISGNTESTVFTGNAEVKWDGERWHHSVLGRALGKSEEKVTTAEAYKAAYQGKLDLSGRTYLFGLLDYNKDRFSSYDQQFFQTLGIGQRILQKDRHELNGEISAGASQSTLILDVPPGGTEDINEAVFRVSADYKWMISDNSTFSQILNVTSGSSNTYTESVTELSARIVGSLSMVLGYTVKHNSDVSPDKDKTDTFASISLEYLF